MRFIALLISMFAAGCVTTHQGTVVKSEKLSFSCAVNDSVITEHFILYSCSIENPMDQWNTYQVKDIKIKDKGVKLSTPSETQEFAEAYKFEKAKRDYNTSMLLGGLTVAGAAVAAGSGNSNTGRTASAVAVGAGAGAVGKGVHGEYTKAQYGTEHMLSDPFRIPPKLFVRKSFLVERETPQGRLTKFDVCFKSPEQKCLPLEINYIGSDGRDTMPH